MNLSYSYPSTTIFNSKNLNRRIILDLVRFTPGGISRAELARQTELTRAAITSIIGDMMKDGLLQERENGAPSGGRRPILLEINPHRGMVAGIDMGYSHLSVLVADFAAGVLADTEIPFNISDGPHECLNQLDHQVKTVLAKTNLAVSDILSIGVGVPGPVDTQAGKVIAPPIMPGWHDYPIQDRLEELWGRPVTINNDAELGAIGEWAYGAARGERNLAYIKVGSGIGAGLILDGHIYGGATGSAGEIGHVTILHGGPRCTCGNSGCLEALAGGNAIARIAREAVAAGRRTHLSSISPVEAITARHVTTAARMGDLVAQQIVTEAGTYLGIAVASLVNLFNPNVVVVGGGVSQMGDLLLEPIRKAVQERSLPSAAKAVRISAALLGRRSSGMGAVAQALNAAFMQLA